jgi:hypothetical protein
MGQSIQRISGTVVSSVNKSGLPFCTISILNSNQATLAKENGSFDFSFLRHRSDTLLISMLGYTAKKITVDSIKIKDSLIIELVPETFEIPVINIEGLSAKETVIKAIKNLSENFPDSPMLVQSYYRQVHKEDNEFVRLIEAIVITNEMPRPYYQNKVANEKVFISCLRRSNVYEQNHEQHGDHLTDLLDENPFKFPVGTVLNLKGIDFFSFHFKENKSDADFMIEFSSIHSTDDKIQNGMIWIDPDQLIIKRILIKTFPNPESKITHFAAMGQPYLWELRNGSYDITFKKVNGRYITDHIIKSYSHELYDTRVHSLAHIVEENFEWIPFKFLSDATLNQYHFTSSSNLYSQKYDYHSVDWLEFPPCPKEILRDLEKEIPIGQQYISNGK